MTTESTIDSLANLMIEKYGAEARYTAAERSRVLRDCSDRRTSRTWFQISKRIDKIAPPPPKSDPLPWPEQIDHMQSTPAEVDSDQDVADERAKDPELVG